MNICIFCGSNPGARPAYAHAAIQLGELMASRGIGLVYGGGGVGMMGVVADTVMQKNGQAVGVITRALVDREVGHRGLTALHVVETMHERKAKMAELADAFIVLPGGIGTMEEFFEIWTWGYLGIHAKPFGILNVEEFYDPLVTFLDHVVREQFMKGETRAMVVVEKEPDILLRRLAHTHPMAADKVITPSET